MSIREKFRSQALAGRKIQELSASDAWQLEHDADRAEQVDEDRKRVERHMKREESGGDAMSVAHVQHREMEERNR